jgi:hypothetical protein
LGRGQKWARKKWKVNGVAAAAELVGRDSGADKAAEGAKRGQKSGDKGAGGEGTEGNGEEEGEGERNDGSIGRERWVAKENVKRKI